MAQGRVCRLLRCLVGSLSFEVFWGTFTVKLHSYSAAAAVIIGLSLPFPQGAFAASKPKAPKGSVIVSSSNAADFLALGRSGKNKVSCRIAGNKDGGIAVGYVKKDPALKKNLWRSLSTLIKDVKKSSLGKVTKQKQIKALQKVQGKFLLLCQDSLATPTPPPTSTSLPTETPTQGPTPTNTATPTVTPTSTPTSTPTLLPSPTAVALLDAGGPLPPITPSPDSQGRIWGPDEDVVVESTKTYIAPGPIAPPPSGTAYPQILLRSQRYGDVLHYHFAINDGTWDVVMFFAEVSAGLSGGTTVGLGQRVFDVKIQGVTVAQNIDIFALSGGVDTQYSLVFPNIVVPNGTGTMDIELTPSAGSLYPPALAVLEIRDPGALVPHNNYDPNTGQGTNFGLDVGSEGNDYTQGAVTWQDDQPFIVGSSRIYHNQSNPAISGTIDDFLFWTERHSWLSSTLSYKYVGLANRTYNVTLGFAEVTAAGLPGEITAAGQRTFDIRLEGNTVQNAFDIYATAGAFAAVNKSFLANVSDGVLDVDLVPVVGSGATVSTLRIDILNLTVTPTFVDFGSGPGQRSITLLNNSAMPINVTGFSVVGTDSLRFSPSGTPQTLAANGGSMQVQVTFAPNSAGPKVAQLRVATSDNSVAGGTYSIELRGIGQ